MSPRDELWAETVRVARMAPGPEKDAAVAELKRRVAEAKAKAEPDFTW